jgi:hypothetical protein
MAHLFGTRDIWGCIGMNAGPSAAFDVGASNSAQDDTSSFVWRIFFGTRDIWGCMEMNAGPSTAFDVKARQTSLRMTHLLLYGASFWYERYLGLHRDECRSFDCV